MIRFDNGKKLLVNVIKIFFFVRFKVKLNYF